MSVRNVQYWEGAVVRMEERARNLLGMEQSNAAKEEVSRLQLNITYAPTTFWDYLLYSRPTTVIHVESADNRSQEEREADRAKVIGTILAAGAALATGLFAATYGEVSRALSSTKEIEDHASKDFGGPKGGDMFPCLTELVQAQLNIDQRNYDNARWKLTAAVVLLAGGVSIAAGGFMVSSALMTAGYVTAIFGMIGMLGTIGYHWRDSGENRKDARNVVKYAEEVRSKLSWYEIHEVEEAGERKVEFCKQESQKGSYVPLYGEPDVPEEGAPGYTSGQPSAPEQVEGATS